MPRSKEPITKDPTTGRYVLVVDVAAPGEKRKQRRRRFATYAEARVALEHHRLARNALPAQDAPTATGGDFSLPLSPSVDLLVAAAALGISRSAAYRAADAQTFPVRTFKIGRQHRVIVDEMLTLLKGQSPTTVKPLMDQMRELHEENRRLAREIARLTGRSPVQVAS